MNMSKEEKIVIASALICQVLVIFAIIILGNMYFPYTGLDYEDLCRRNDYCIHSNYSSSFNEKIEIIF